MQWWTSSCAYDIRAIRSVVASCSAPSSFGNRRTVNHGARVLNSCSSRTSNPQRSFAMDFSPTGRDALPSTGTSHTTDCQEASTKASLRSGVSRGCSGRHVNQRFGVHTRSTSRANLMKSWCHNGSVRNNGITGQTSGSSTFRALKLRLASASSFCGKRYACIYRIVVLIRDSSRY